MSTLHSISNLGQFRAIVIGGSAGSFSSVKTLIDRLPNDFPLPIIVVMHRLKSKRSGFTEVLSIDTDVEVKEPDDKEYIDEGVVYVAPANYHLLVEKNETLALSEDELENHSRPSIDIMFKSAAEVYGDGLLAILLSGANDDGAKGLKKIKELKGITIVQDPSECDVSIMPQAAIGLSAQTYIMSLNGISDVIHSFTK